MGFNALVEREARKPASDNVQLPVQPEFRGQQKQSLLRKPLWDAIEPGCALRRNCLRSNVGTEFALSVSFKCRGDVSLLLIGQGAPSPKGGVKEFLGNAGGRSPNKSLNRTRYSGLFFRGWRIITTEKPAVTRRLTQR